MKFIAEIGFVVASNLDIPGQLGYITLTETIDTHRTINTDFIDSETIGLDSSANLLSSISANRKKRRRDN